MNVQPTVRLSTLGAFGLIIFTVADRQPQLIGVPVALALGMYALVVHSPGAIRVGVFFLIFVTDIGKAFTTGVGGPAYEQPTVYAVSIGGLGVPMLLAACLFVSANSIPRQTRQGLRRGYSQTTWVASGVAIVVGSANGLLSGNGVVSVLVGASTYVWLLIGVYIASRVDVRATIIAALGAKAIVTVGYYLTGVGLVSGDVLRPSFDSYWLALPLVLSAAIIGVTWMPALERVGFGVAACAASLLSLTRQAWVAMAAAVILLFFLAREGRQRWSVFAASVFVVVAGFVILGSSGTPAAYVSRLESIPTELGAMASASRDLRFSEILQVGHTVGNQFLWGRGFGATFSFREVPVGPLTAAAYGEAELATGEFSQAHLPLVTLYLRVGVIGLVCWTVAVLLPVMRLMPRGRRDDWALVVLAGAPLLLLGPWTSKLELLAGLIVGTALVQADSEYALAGRKDGCTNADDCARSHIAE